MVRSNLPTPFLLRINVFESPNFARRIDAVEFKIYNHILKIIYRENEVLKHQLRKYVSAVQMLKRDDADHSYEAQLYESKLVQVWELCRTKLYPSCSGYNRERLPTSYCT